MSEALTFNPRQINTCQLWLDGADPNGNGVLPANNSAIATWTDKSGSGNNLSRLAASAC